MCCPGALVRSRWDAPGSWALTFAEAALELHRTGRPSAYQPTLASISVLRNRSISSMNRMDGTSRMSAVIAAIW